MEFRLLGPVEVLQGAVPIPLPARGKERCLLAVFLINAGQVLSKDTLISHAWDGDPLTVAEGTFRSYLNRVKGVIDAAGGQAKLVSRDGGYQLRIPADWVDVQQFKGLRHQADVAVRNGDPDQAIALLCKAEALWRGPALAGLSGQWASAMQAGLEDERRNCILKRVGLELDRGRHAELLSELRRLRLRYPEDEICARHEMVALYRCGRQPDALEAFRRIRDHLVEHGLEPGPELVGIHQRILAHNLAQPDAMRMVSPERLPKIPDRKTTFVGRAEDMQRLTAKGSGAPRAWVISGLSGVGKTSLALEAARRLTGEVLYLDFHANDDDRSPLSADTALRRLLEEAGVHRSGLPKGQAELAALWQREVAGRQMSIVLDDVPDAGSVEQLLPQEGSCYTFITARHRLGGLAGASELSLDALPEDDAITLFRQIAGMEDGGDSAAVAMVVRQCEFLPYAITITAGRIRRDGGITASVISANLAETGAMNDSVQSVLDSSYLAITEQERRLVRFLGMNICPSFTAESAAVMANVPVRVAGDMISALFDRHLIESAVGGGLRLHDLLRNYAAARAARDISGADRRDAERRLLDYYLSRVDQADRELYPHRRHSVLPLPRSGPDSVANSRRWLELEWRNVLKVAEHAGRHERQQDCAELTHMLAGFLEIEGFWGESIDAHGRALRACRDLGDQRLVARALIDLSRACLERGRQEDALVYANQALEIYRSVGVKNGEAVAIGLIGIIYYNFGNIRDMLACEQDARSLYVRSGDFTGEAEAGFHLGIACVELGQVGEGMNNFRNSLEIFERSGNWRGAASALNGVAEISLREGRHRDAIADYRRVLSIWREMGAKKNCSILTLNIGRVHLYKDDPGRALTEFKCALTEFRQLRDFPWEARAMCDCGDAHLAMGDFDQGQTYYRQAAVAATEVGDMSARAMACRGMADVCRESDRFDEAMRKYQEALKLAQDVEEPFQRAMIMDGMAKTMLRTGKVSAGRIRLRQARDLYRAASAIEAARSADLRLHMLGDPTSDWVKLPTA